MNVKSLKFDPARNVLTASYKSRLTSIRKYLTVPRYKYFPLAMIESSLYETRAIILELRRRFIPSSAHLISFVTGARVRV